MKQRGKIYQCYVRPVLLYRCETWEPTVADKVRLLGVKPQISMTCGVRFVNRVLTEEGNRPRKSWQKCKKKDLGLYDLGKDDAYDREKWREQIKAKIASPGQPR